MRFDERITFMGVGERVWNDDLGDFVTEPIKLDTKACHVSDLGLDRSMQVFGDYSNSRRVVRLERPYNELYDHLMYLGVKYRMVAERLNGAVLYIEKDSVGEQQ